MRGVFFDARLFFLVGSTLLAPACNLELFMQNQIAPKNLVHFSICACHPCTGAILIFSVSFQFYRMIPEGNPT